MKAVEMVPEVSIQKALEALKKGLLNALQDNLLNITFFGSRVNGRFVPESDVDVFVLVRTKDRAVTYLVFSISEEVEEKVLRQNFSFSIHLYDLETFQNLKMAGSLFIKEIESEGVVVYEGKADS